MRTPFAWGSHDCLLLAADWCREHTGLDPAERYRGRYRTELGARRLLARAGGLLPLVETEMAHHGLAAAEAPRAGDVGVVMAVTRRGLEPVGAIFDGRLWTMLGLGGLVAGEFPLRKSWRLPWPTR